MKKDETPTPLWLIIGVVTAVAIMFGIMFHIAGNADEIIKRNQEEKIELIASNLAVKKDKVIIEATDYGNYSVFTEDGVYKVEFEEDKKGNTTIKSLVKLPNGFAGEN